VKPKDREFATQNTEADKDGRERVRQTKTDERERKTDERERDREFGRPLWQ
jgi:hypothetical protein